MLLIKFEVFWVCVRYFVVVLVVFLVESVNIEELFGWWLVKVLVWIEINRLVCCFWVFVMCICNGMKMFLLCVMYIFILFFFLIRECKWWVICNIIFFLCVLYFFIVLEFSLLWLGLSIMIIGWLCFVLFGCGLFCVGGICFLRLFLL